MNAGEYLLGIFFLAMALVPLAVAARTARKRLCPDWTAPDATLADAVIFIALLLGVCELLGTVGLFRFWFVLVGSVLAAVTVLAVVRTYRPRRIALVEPPSSRRGVRPDPYAPVVGIVIAVVVVGMWILHTRASLRGISSFDSTNYHLPFAARFLQGGHTLRLVYAKPGDETAFDPLNSELLVAFFMMPFHRDVLIPFLNIGWAALALLAGWCIGRTRGVGELTLATVAIILVTPLMMHTNAGQATNDVVAIALLLSTVALLMRAEGRLAAIAVAGAAAGLTVGTKLTVVIPLLILTLGLSFTASRGRRFRSECAWLAPIVITGGYWYVRNLIAIGNPVPTVHLALGPISLPTPRFSGVDSLGFTVAHYATSSRAIQHYILPGLVRSLGSAWPLTVALAACGMVLALLALDRLLVVFGTTAIVAFGAYFVTPTSAAGPPGMPMFFSYNSRYAYPALTIGLLLVPLCLAPRLALPWRRLVLLVLLVALAAEQWQNMALTLTVTLAVGLGIAHAAASREHSNDVDSARRSLRIAAAVAIIGCVFTGYFVQRLYLQRRYVNDTPYRHDQNDLYAWARTISHMRIAADGVDESYPLNGLDLSNYVERIGVHGHAGSFEHATNCLEWRHEIARGHYDFIVFDNGTDVAWARAPSIDEVFHNGRFIVFKVVSPVDPNACPAPVGQLNESASQSGHPIASAKSPARQLTPSASAKEPEHLASATVKRTRSRIQPSSASLSVPANTGRARLR